MDVADLVERLKAMEAVQNQYILEREEVTRAISICLITRGHLLLTGPPGVAKTTQVRLATRHIRGGVYFHVQLTPFSTVEDLFGPIDLAAYKAGQRRRSGTGMLQEAHLAVIDEIYNGNEAVLKALLAPMNEGVYAEHGQFHPIPLRTLMGTANSIPGPEERREKGLSGFHDRWLFRFVVQDIQSDTNFVKMLWTPDIDFETYEPDPAATISPEELAELGRAAARVRVPVGIYEELARIRRRLQEAQLYCSPRRWKQICFAMQASALLSGRSDVTEEDFSLLRHTLWNEVDDIPRVERILEEYLTTARDRAGVKFSRILEICGEFQEKRRSMQNPADVAKLALEARSRMEERIQEMKNLRLRATSEEERMAIDRYLQRAYEYLREMDQAAGM